MAKRVFYRVGVARVGSVFRTMTLPSGEKVITFDEETYLKALAAASAVLRRAMERKPK